MESPILQTAKKVYKDKFKKDPAFMAIHAGLECALFSVNYPNWDMISFGPTLRGVHAPGEKLELASMDKFIALLEDVVVHFA